jgi:hypothetical protein
VIRRLQPVSIDLACIESCSGSAACRSFEKLTPC